MYLKEAYKESIAFQVKIKETTKQTQKQFILVRGASVSNITKISQT